MLTLPTSTTLPEAATDLPLVSILINNYNYSQFLADCLNSCISQSYSNCEIVVVDDGSTDHSAEIIRQYAAQAPHMKPLLKENGGQASALNAGFRLSRGEFVVLLDADDYLFPDGVAQMMSVWAETCSSVVMLQSRLELVDQEGRFIDLYPAPELKLDRGNVVPALLKKGRYATTVTSGLSFRRVLLEDVMPIPEADFRLCADGYLVTVAPFVGTITCLEQPIGGRRKHFQNLWTAQTEAISPTQRQRSLAHDFLRYEHLAQAAAHYGYGPLAPPLSLGLNDTLHLFDRLMSLRLAPDQHPVPSDRPLQLCRYGFWAITTEQSLGPRRRFVLLLWFLWVALAPHPWAKTAIHWRLSSQARPRLMDKLLKVLRKLSP